MLLAAVVLLSGCSLLYRLRTNGKRKQVFETECGKVKFVARGASGGDYYYFSITADRDIVVDTDKIDIFPVDAAMEMREVVWMIGDEKVAGAVELKRRRKLWGNFAIYYPFDGNMYDRTVIIPPDDYIKCNGVPVITDTLRIK